MTATERDALAAGAMDLIPWQARRFRLPRGLSTDDLESAGHEGLLDALTAFDPAAGTGFRTFARACIKNAMRDVVRAARSGVRGKAVPLGVFTADGEELPREDRRADDPAEVAAARELVLAPRPAPAKRPGRDIGAGLPSPAEVADQVTALRAAMFGAIRTEDVQQVMQGVVDRAKAGNERMVRLLIDLLAPGRSGVTVHQQQAVIVHKGEIG